MEEKDIFLLDPLFDFSSVYKRHYCTLFNIKIFEVSIKISYSVDGEAKVLKQSEENLFSIQYREWASSNYFGVKPNAYFSSEEIAKNYFLDNVEKFGLIKVTKDEAIELARENLKLQAEMQQRINKG